MIRKTSIVLLLCLLFFSGVLYATTSLPADRSLFLVHTFASNATYHFSFKNMADNPADITSADVSSGGKFARVVINFTDDIPSYHAVLKFKPLKHETVANAYCEYTMEVLVPGSNDILVAVVPDLEEGHSACSASLSGSMFYELSSGWQNEYLAELKITLDIDSAIAGNYSGTIIIEQVTDGGNT